MIMRGSTVSSSGASPVPAYVYPLCEPSVALQTNFYANASDKGRNEYVK